MATNPLEDLLGDNAPTDQNPPVEEPKEPETPAFDPQAFKAELMNEITDLMKPQKEEPAEEEHFQPDTWDDVLNKQKEIAEETLEEKETKRVQESQERERQQRVARETIDKEFDKQIKEAEEAGNLTPIKDPKDENDPGRQARKELFGLAIKFGTTNLSGVAEELKIMHEQGLAFDPKANKTIRVKPSGFGRMAPVGSSSTTTGTAPTVGLSYDELHKSSLDALIERSQDV